MIGERIAADDAPGRLAIASLAFRTGSEKKDGCRLAWKRGRIKLAKLRELAPITAISVEHVKFDTQKMQNPEISGIEYQQGTLLGYEIREYLLEKWDRRCAYCDAEDVEFQVEHVHPKDLGGLDRVSNLALACSLCNTSKNNQPLTEFLARDAGRLSTPKPMPTRIPTSNRSGPAGKPPV